VTSRRPWRPAGAPVRVLAAATVALMAVACSGGGSDGEPSPSASQSGGDIVVGLINTEDAPVGSFPELRRGVLAAERYVNDELGGVDGRPLRIEACTTTGTPESSQGCANQLLAQQPVAVIGGVDLGAAASLPPLQTAGIPYVTGTPSATQALTADGTFALTGGTATEILGEVAYAVDTLHATGMAGVYSDVPGLLSDAASLLSTIVRNKGVQDFRLVPVGSVPDLVPSLTSAGKSDPDAILAVFPAQACTRVMRGVTAVGLRARMMYPSFCAEDSVFAAAGKSAEGGVFATGYVPYVDTDDDEVATYLSALRRYDADLDPSLLSQAGFSVVMVLQQLMSETAGELSPQTLTATLRATHGHPNFMGHSFTCDGKQVVLLGGLCNAYVRIATVHDGRLRPVGGWVDTAPVANLVSR
jgi:branched-chain amino acid transport system substrate-binding protein